MTTLTKLDWRIAQEEPDIDLETDLYTCTCSDGWTVAAPTLDECNAIRTVYEARLSEIARLNVTTGWQRVYRDDLREAMKPRRKLNPILYREDAELYEQFCEQNQEGA